MKERYLLSAALAVCMSVALSCGVAEVEKPDEALTSVTFEKVSLEDDFWLPRLKIQKETLVPFSLEKTETAVENLRLVGQYLKTGKEEKMHPLARYVASDLFKVMEGAAYLLTLEDDPELEKRMDEIIDIIADAQCEDGYLYEPLTVPETMYKRTRSTGYTRYSYVLHSHELYDMGHMYEAAIAYYKATGKRKWLDVAEKNARHINKVFFEGDPAYNGGEPVNEPPGHEEIELALVKMYETTGDALYLDMAKKFIDIRGQERDPEVYYSQQHMPVREQREAVGHSVRALYLYSGMADIVAQTGDTTLNPALEAIWHDIADKKIHINGGLGSVPGIEGFGPAYMLPNKDTYDETCAAVGNVFFNYRMFLATGDAKYVDMAEISLYNNVLAGVNLEGNRFFYVNVLEADGRKPFNHGRAGRSPWFGTACCPSNLARLIPQVSGMMYSQTDSDIFCSFYAGNSVELDLPAGKVGLKQQTAYPYDGKVTIEVTPEAEDAEFTLWLQIPTWTGDRFIPGELYSYADNAASGYSVKVNGRKVRAEVEDGFFPVARAWKAGDKVELELDMPVRYSVADERVEADINRMCLTRGPLLYCAEQPDNQHAAYMYIINDTKAPAEVGSFEDGIMKGITTIGIDASALTPDGTVVESPLLLIPYYAWNNRGDNTTMNVWFARDYETILASLPKLADNVAFVDATHTYSGDDVTAVADGKRPSHSFDRTIPRWTSWNKVGKPQQVTISLKKPQEIESVSVYWYEDDSGVKLPVSWTMDYMEAGEWKTFEPYTTDRFGIEKDQFNMVHPSGSVKAEALRLNIVPKPDKAVGILEVVIE